jgi:penicillin amidase
VYESLLLELLRTVFGDTLDGDVLRRYLRRDDAALVLLDLSGRPQDPWWGEGRDQAMERALRRAVRELEKRLGRDRTRWRWDRLNVPVLEHPLGRVPVLRWIFNVRAPSIGGDAFTVNVAAFDPDDPFRVVLTPSYRRVVDMKTLEARAMHSPGQSGLPFHGHYQDFLGPWARGEYHPLLMDREQIAAVREGILILRPR